jgi:hypothetical protein
MTTKKGPTTNWLTGNLKFVKLRYPRGESYLDLISRIEPIIFEIERSR